MAERANLNYLLAVRLSLLVLTLIEPKLIVKDKEPYDWRREREFNVVKIKKKLDVDRILENR